MGVKRHLYSNEGFVFMLRDAGAYLFACGSQEGGEFVYQGNMKAS